MQVLWIEECAWRCVSVVCLVHDEVLFMRELRARGAWLAAVLARDAGGVLLRHALPAAR